MITAHVIAADGADHHQILHEVDTCLGEDFDLGHCTIQVEHVSRPLDVGRARASRGSSCRKILSLPTRSEKTGSRLGEGGGRPSEHR